ncbi:beta-Ala-His dipeptidase [Hippea maritima]|uniref:Cytosol non-specific dipeptidase n=1 Tax=Hippea maritima (strain ATCC 700847 / DSM 10411 / MH2) TaxID=760142 RepID=F2LU13_HIPMA|nr:beta-Ala-His dipeptidase [Hippea maritima]AEA33412.1 aminoacyl-histidine dipeptidase [Hippea maritima DSM 10411]
MIDRVIEIFEEISNIPRCSKNCFAISSYLCRWAKENGFECRQDDALNVFIDVPASAGFEKKPVVALQGHMDMVCVKREDSNHDFDEDPIKVYRNGDWLKADGTTLGADNGIALALAMAIAMDKSLEHPPLQLIFTADEEIGLIGASKIDSKMIKADELVNIDSETEGVFVIGCAGGEDSELSMDIYRRNERRGEPFKIVVSGLLGGHSGMEINKNRANAIKVINEILKDVFDFVELAYLHGGRMRNAIPSSAEAWVYVKDLDGLKGGISFMSQKFKSQYYQEDIKIDIIEANFDKKPISKADFSTIIELIDKLPHGVYRMYDDRIPMISDNLAIVDMDENKLSIATNQRSLTEEGLDEIMGIIEKIAGEFSCSFDRHSRYSSWTPNRDSRLLKKAIGLWSEMYKQKPMVEVIHAGLECGIIGSKKKGIDMISLGPNIENAHTPDERLSISSTERVYKFICELLKR